MKLRILTRIYVVDSAMQSSKDLSTAYGPYDMGLTKPTRQLES